MHIFIVVSSVQPETRPTLFVPLRALWGSVMAVYELRQDYLMLQRKKQKWMKRKKYVDLCTMRQMKRKHCEWKKGGVYMNNTKWG
jgi:hypothetical protein